MRTYLAKPWASALLVTAVYLVVSLVLLLENDASDDRGSAPSERGPDALEVAMTPLSALFVFAAAWVVLRFIRARPLAGERDLETGAARPPRSPT